MIPRLVSALALLPLLAQPLRAQRLSPSYLGPPFHLTPPSAIGPFSRDTWHAGSGSGRPTYWLEGAVIGAFLGSFVGIVTCRLHEDTRSCAGPTGAGALVGFTVGALFGGQFKKSPSGFVAPPPNQRLKLSARGGRLVGNESVLSAAAAGRSLSAIR